MSNKISRDTITSMYEALKVAMAVKCDELLFDDFGITGRSTVTNILIIQPRKDPFEFEALGVGRVPELHARLRLIIDDDSLSGTFDEGRDGKVNKIIFKTKKTKVEFRCKDPNHIKTKKQFNDKTVITFSLNADAIKFMTMAASAMKVESISFKVIDGSVFIRVIDGEGDVLDHLVTDAPTITDESAYGLTCSYSIPKLAPVLNAHKESTVVNISSRKLLNLTSEGFNLFIVPDII